MPIDTQHIFYKVEMAITQLIAAEADQLFRGAKIAKGTENAALTVPYCTVIYEGAKTDPEIENYRGEARIIICTSSNDETGSDHSDRCRSVQNIMATDDIASRLSDLVEGFTVIYCKDKSFANILEGSHWRFELVLDLYCADADL